VTECQTFCPTTMLDDHTLLNDSNCLIQYNYSHLFHLQPEHTPQFPSSVSSLVALWFIHANWHLNIFCGL